MNEMKQNPLTIEAFLSWVEGKPSAGYYPYIDSDNCACARYSRHLGMQMSKGERLPEWRCALYEGHPFWSEADDIAAEEPHSFGGLAVRLRAALSRATAS